MRPRWGADGGLIPAKDVSVARLPDGEAWLLCRLEYEPNPDPYGRVPGTDLLLAEDLARADLSTPEAARDWYARRGALAFHLSWPKRWPELPAGLPPSLIADRYDDVLAYQAGVAWHLLTIARLGQEERPFDPAWVDVALALPEGRVRITTPRGAKRLRLEADGAVDPDVPTILVPSVAWDEWRQEAAGDRQADRIGGARRLTADRDGLIELERRLLAPWLRQLGRHSPSLRYQRESGGPLDISTFTFWESVTGPITMQLVEGLIRATEDRVGGTFCRECGRPFLVLDARRTAFCTDLERNRHDQRLHQRKRRAEARAASGKDAAP